MSNDNTCNLNKYDNGIKTKSRIIPVYLGKKEENSRVLITAKNGKCIVVEVQSRTDQEKEWVTEYERELPGWNNAEVLAGYWETVCRYIAAVYTVSADGRLQYLVLAKRKDTIGEILERKNIKNGALRLDGGKLLEAEGNRCYRWENIGRRLVLIKHKNLPIPGALLIEYRISKKGMVEIPQKAYSVKPGTIIQFVRADDSPCAEKLLYSSSGGLRCYSQLYSFQVINRCRLEFKIVPDGNEEKSEKIIIEVKG